MRAPVLMVVGTASSVGKSVMVTALCRIFHQDGMRVAPFKAQNMSNNADVTLDGREIGRAQSEQAAAAGIAPTVEMNPVLLKPQGDRTSQLVLNGRPAGALTSTDFDRRRDLWPDVERALESLRARFELVIAEGAGSPAEPNLYATDIVNMRVARHAQAPTLLVGDIDAGGVFAHFVGTLALLPPEDRRLVRGLVINRFRGERALLAGAVADVEARTGVPVLGVVPWITDLRVAAEDAVVLERAGPPADTGPPPIDIAVIRLPRIANFDDFDPLVGEPGVRVRFVKRAEELGTPTAIILPGTKATIADLSWLHASGLADRISARAELGAHVLGICGGYQMLGRTLADPHGVEAPAGTTAPGLALLPVATEFAADKATRRVVGRVAAATGPWAAAAGLPLTGYEIHMGRSRGDAPALLELDGRGDGAVSEDGRVAGTYLHGIFFNDAVRAAWLQALGRTGAATTGTPAARERAFDDLAAVVRAHLDITRIRAMLR